MEFGFKLCVIMSLLLVSRGSLAQHDKHLEMFVWSTSLAPIISLDSSNAVEIKNNLQQYKGIFVDVIASLPSEQQVEVNVNIVERTRGERALYAGVYDMSILSKEWLSQPEDLIYSLPIYVHREFLYAVDNIPDQSLEKLINKRYICTRRNYKYPKIERFFKQHIAARIDSDSEDVLFKMLLRGRCDFLVTNDFVGQAIIDKNHYARNIVRSTKPLDEVNFTIAFHPRNSEFVAVLNTHIKALNKSGKLSDIIKKHRKKMTE